MSLAVDDTIAAIATAPGLGLRGIVRLSGPGTSACLEKSLCLEAGGTLPETSAPSCSQVLFHCPSPIGDLPCQLYHWPTTSSYTRQVSAEIHLPGAPVLMESVLEHLCRNGARLARPGEFTLRAFLAGRLDLTQAEAVLGVIHASGEEELTDALEQLAGGLASPLQQLRTRLLDLLVGGTFCAVADIGSNLVGEQERCLRDVTDRLSQPRQRPLIQGNPVEQDPSLCRFDESWNQPCHGGLARA